MNYQKINYKCTWALNLTLQKAILSLPSILFSKVWCSITNKLYTIVLKLYQAISHWQSEHARFLHNDISEHSCLYLYQQYITIIADKSLQILHSYFHLYGMQERDIKIVLSIITLRKKITESNAVKL